VRYVDSQRTHSNEGHFPAHNVKDLGYNTLLLNNCFNYNTLLQNTITIITHKRRKIFRFYHTTVEDLIVTHYYWTLSL